MSAILLTGASGLLGTQLTRALKSEGATIIPLRRNTVDGLATWDTDRHRIQLHPTTKYDAVIHLAGENIAAGYWTASRKRAIQESRINGTRALIDALNGSAQRPKVLLSASAIGFYGTRGDELLNEESAPGDGFLPELAVAWEREALRAQQLGIRVVLLRFGIIMSPQGGALAKMLPAFTLGLGGRLGNGKQWMSWIAIEDVVSAILFLLHDSSASGVYNIVAPHPVTNAEFTSALAGALRRPALFHVPRFALRLLLGELADAALLASQRVAPHRLLSNGFTFSQPTLHQCLAAQLPGRTKAQ